MPITPYINAEELIMHLTEFVLLRSPDDLKSQFYIAVLFRIVLVVRLTGYFPVPVLSLGARISGSAPVRNVDHRG